MGLELIDTCWNVNSLYTSFRQTDKQELIDTCWNVNRNKGFIDFDTGELN